MPTTPCQTRHMHFAGRCHTKYATKLSRAEQIPAILFNSAEIRSNGYCTLTAIAQHVPVSWRSLRLDHAEGLATTRLKQQPKSIANNTSRFAFDAR
ncbi:hypothetical protein Mal52_58750 [Symmachiella dynata]|uniref:Uncharacterized protein n=1 Tax=Symmachiella dynata TaxID=2527995 RepID=A0A517ZY29_9PLAN|nr:hypothetical protein Mal52_58750 [Symmachiella dynata]